MHSYCSVFQLVLCTMDNAGNLLNERDYPTRKWDAPLNIGTFKRRYDGKCSLSCLDSVETDLLSLVIV